MPIHLGGIVYRSKLLICFVMLLAFVFSSCSKDTVSISNPETEKNIDAKNYINLEGYEGISVDLNALTFIEGCYYQSVDSIPLAVYNKDKDDFDYRMFKTGDKFNSLYIEAIYIQYYYGYVLDDTKPKLYYDLSNVMLKGPITLSGHLNMIDQNTTHIVFIPSEESWDNMPVMPAKEKIPIPVFTFRNISEFESYFKSENIYEQSSPITLTLDNLLLKSNNGSASGEYDYADIISVIL